MQSSPSVCSSVSTLSLGLIGRCPWTCECEWVVPITHQKLKVKVRMMWSVRPRLRDVFLLVNLAMFILQLYFPKFDNYCHLLSIICTKISLTFARMCQLLTMQVFLMDSHQIMPNLLLRYFLLNFVTFSITRYPAFFHYHIIIKHSIRIK